MGLLIRASQDDLRAPEDLKKDPTCIVCSRKDSDKEINDVEKIFGALQDMEKENKNLSEADDLMCEYHSKKAKGLKIFSSKDELFELSTESILKEKPKYNKISNEEYNSKVEKENGKTNL